jgi:signal transduction histidine kinase
MPASSTPPTRHRGTDRPARRRSADGHRCADPGGTAGQDDGADVLGDPSPAAWLQRRIEAERAALARELHDELGAILTAARLDVAWLAAQPGCAGDPIGPRLAALQQVLAQGIELKRRIVEDLHPTVLTHLGLVAALEQLVASHRARFAGRLVASLDERAALRGEPALALYRIAQEALTNVHRYAGARTLRVSLERIRGAVVLGVEDDGCGFDPGRVGSGHHGLAGMRHRICSVGGRLEVSAAPGRGTEIRATVPLAERRSGRSRAAAPIVAAPPD